MSDTADTTIAQVPDELIEGCVAALRLARSRPGTVLAALPEVLPCLGEIYHRDVRAVLGALDAAGYVIVPASAVAAALERKEAAV